MFLSKPLKRVSLSTLISTLVATPWYTSSKFTKDPPNTSPIACCPKHTPKILFVGAYFFMISFNKPASSGIPGPGESTIFSNGATSSSANLSFLYTVTSQFKSSK